MAIGSTVIALRYPGRRVRNRGGPLTLNESLHHGKPSFIPFGNRVVVKLHPAPLAPQATTGIAAWIWLLLAICVVVAWAFVLTSRR